MKFEMGLAAKYIMFQAAGTFKKLHMIAIRQDMSIMLLQPDAIVWHKTASASIHHDRTKLYANSEIDINRSHLLGDYTMSIIKNTPNILKHSGNFFTTILNKTIEAIADPATLGIYLYLTSKPNDWDISITNLKNRFGKGEDFIKTRLSELKRIGLLKSVAIKNEKGQIIRWETVLYNEVKNLEYEPIIQKNQKVEKPPCGKSTRVVNPPITNNIYKQKKDTTTENDIAVAMVDDDDPVKILKKYEIKPPRIIKKHIKKYIDSAVALLSSHGFSLDEYLNYLTNRCQRALLPYITNGIERQNGFGNILRPSFINDVINGKWAD